MANQALSMDEILGIVNETASPTTGYPPPQQYGPIRWSEKEFKCQHKRDQSKRRCDAPTYARLFSVPYCTVHLIGEVNRLLYELLEEKELPHDAAERSGSRSHNFEIKYKTGGEE